MPSYNQETKGEEVVNAFPKAVRGKTFLITGPSSGGLGAETAQALAAAGPAQLILVGRSAEKMHPVVTAIENAAPTKIEVKTFVADFDSIASIRSAAQSILADDSINMIDGIVNNVGVMGIAEYSVTQDGIEEHLGVNHISHFLLTNLLLPCLADQGRVINLSSYAHLFANLDFEDPTFASGKTYNPWESYAASKTANILFAVELNRRFGSRLQAFAVNPGSINTQLRRHMTPDTLKSGMLIHQKNKVAKPEPKTLEQGVATGLRALLDPELTTENGVYLDDCEVVNSSKNLAQYAVDPENARQCWTLSETLVKEQFFA